MSIDYFIFLDIIGIIAFSISGFLISIKNDLDLLGGFIVCMLTALGGGITRDVLANNIAFSFLHLYPLIVVIIVFIISIFSNFMHKISTTHKNIYNISDSIGLVFFAITGAIVAIEANFHIIGVAIISLVSATGGGVLRDIAIGRVPTLFKEDFYGMVAIIVGILMFIENTYYEINNTIIIVNMFIGLAIRYISMTNKVSLPKL
jgi:uncharacterized membrane protein YeiH